MCGAIERVAGRGKTCRSGIRGRFIDQEAATQRTTSIASQVSDGSAQVIGAIDRDAGGGDKHARGTGADIRTGNCVANGDGRITGRVIHR